MWSELIGRIDEMYGASLLSIVAAAAMYLNYDGGIVEMCVSGIVALLVAKVVRPQSVPLEEIK